MGIVLLSPALAPPTPPTPPGPAGGLTPALWLSGDRIGGQSGGNPKIAIWDEIGTLNVMSQFNPMLQPSITPNGLNSLPTVRFGLGQYLSAAETNIEYNVPWTLIAVVKTGGHVTLANLGIANGPATVFFDLNATTLSSQIQHSNAQLVNVNWPCTPTAQFKIVSIKYLGSGTAAGLTGYVNGVQQAPTIVSDSLATTSTIANSSWYIGSPGNFSGGEVAEVMLFIPQISDSDRLTVEAYLNTKWFTVPTPTPTGAGSYGTGQEVLNLNAFPIPAPFDQDQ